MNFRRPTIRFKLTVGILVPLMAAIFICWIIGVSIISNGIMRQAQEKVRTDLNAAHEIYLNEIEHVEDIVKFTGQTGHAAAALNAADSNQLKALLSPLLVNERLDILNAIDNRGRIVYRAANPARRGDSYPGDPLIKKALSGQVVSGTLIIPHQQLLRENPNLADRAVIPIHPTERARKSTKAEEQGGMFLVAAAPVHDRDGTVIGALYGGVLLNGNNAIVDKIKRIVYEGEPYQGRNVGTATIFLDDIRIATNVLRPDGERAIGTQLSEEVYNRVVSGGGKWIGRAFVVNDWYFSAYEPIRDLQGRVAGSLYVGMLEKPFTHLKLRVNLIFAGILFFGSLIGILLAGYISSRLASPIKALEKGAREIAGGRRGVAIQAQSSDEIGDLAIEFNQMATALTQREEEIKILNRELERKVLERTAELEEKNLILTKTQRELVQAEKLADIGILAAGVAHEINNPLAIIRGNTELLQMEIAAGNAGREEVDTIADQVQRMERIVANLLQFARQERMQFGEVSLQRMLDEILRQVGHQVPLSLIRIERRYEATPTLQGDELQLRQVFTNLILNAIQAMPEGGTLTVAIGLDEPLGTSHVTISDTGTGIDPDNTGRIFNPFFTTKTTGTGLGLSVSYGIIKDHGGSIKVASEPGKGSAFRVILPVDQSKTPAN